MPMQQQNSSFAKRLGARVSAANAEHKDKPIDLGNRRLPAGIRNGVAKLSTMYTKVSESDDTSAKCPKGETFFRASATVLGYLGPGNILTDSFKGEKISTLITSVIIPLCDIPEKVGDGYKREASPFSTQWYEFQNLFKILGINPPNETPQTDPTGQKVEAYYFMAMKHLTDPNRPVYISFSTRGWTPKATPRNPKPNEFVSEDWHGLLDSSVVTQLNGRANPAAGMKEVAQTPDDIDPPNPSTSQPIQVGGGQEVSAPIPTGQDLADEVAQLVETATIDPEGATPDGEKAIERLEELAWAAGWTKEQTESPPEPFSSDWVGVGDMALNPPTTGHPSEGSDVTPPQGTKSSATPQVGMKYKYRKRTKDGAPLTNNKGEQFPAIDVEVVTVDEVHSICTLKTKDGKDVVDIRSKKPIIVKLEWLEPVK